MTYRTVWVLGAGFSKPLGGPLLPDLFSPASRDRLRATYKAEEKFGGLLSENAELVRRLYAKHGRDGEPTSRHWEDAEQFLEALDSAGALGAASPAGALVRRLTRASTPPGHSAPAEVDLVSMAAMARRLVAAECCAFLRGNDPGSERWAPYERWLTSLGAHDSIITFNYDTVIETLARATKFDRLATVLPGNGLAGAPRVNLLKLHGSVNWEFNDGRFRVHEDDEFALTCPSEQMVIASPGPNKLVVATRLAELWTMAETVLRNATAVVFIGYRFPPSDSSSRRRLFMSLVRNEAPYLALHTVLGPNRSDPATVRIRSLLLHAAAQANRKEALPMTGTRYEQSTSAKSFTLDVHPLWGEDFMDVFVGGHVCQAYRFARA